MNRRYITENPTIGISTHSTQSRSRRTRGKQIELKLKKWLRDEPGLLPATNFVDASFARDGHIPAVDKLREMAMLLGLALFWVGAVLFLNGIWLTGRIGDREIAVIDVFVGTLTLLVALYSAFGPGADAASIKAAALTLLFTFTYFWVAWNRWNGADGRGLGWFCLFVAITTVPVFIETLSGAQTIWAYWFGLSWVAWGVLWFLFFLILAQCIRFAPPLFSLWQPQRAVKGRIARVAYGGVVGRFTP